MDSYWLAQMQKYTALFNAFHSELAKSGVSEDTITHLWIHFQESVCDCDGCREESNCVIHIDVPEYPDDDSELEG
jgi:hypothetical protein